MTTNSFDVIVIGVGAMGAAACRELARRGLSVLGIDRHDIPNDRGSSHGDSRAIRLCYYEHPDYVPLLQHAMQRWHEFNEEAVVDLLITTGALYMGPSDVELITGSVDAARTHDLPHELLDHETLTRRFPQFCLPDDFVGLYEPTGGMLRPEASIMHWAHTARLDGAMLLPREQVVSWKADEHGVEVTTRHETYSAARLVMTTGAWSGPLLGQFGASLTVTRNPLGWIQTSSSEAFGIDRLPVWGIEERNGDFFYGFPRLDDGRPGLKIARHGGGQVTTADTVDRTPNDADKADVRTAAKRLLNGVDGPVLSMHICMYTNTPDLHFLIDTHPQHDRVVVAVGFSGHGFKFAPVVGEVIADLAIDGRTRWPIEFLRNRGQSPLTGA